MSSLAEDDFDDIIDKEIENYKYNPEEDDSDEEEIHESAPSYVSQFCSVKQY